MNGFAELISNRRRELDLGIDEVAAAVDRSTAVLDAWESDRTFPEDPEIVTPLSKILDLPSALLAEAYAQSSPTPSPKIGEVASAPGEAFAADSAQTDSPPEDGVASGADGVASGGDSLVDPPSVTAVVTEVEEVRLSPDEVGGADSAGSVEDAELPESPGEKRSDDRPLEPEQALRLPEPTDRPTVEGSEASDGDLLAKGLALVSEAFESVIRRFRRRRWVSRAPTSHPSYVEDRKQRTTYQLRAIFTGVAVIVLILFIRWSWGQFAEAFGSLWQTLVDAV